MSTYLRTQDFIKLVFKYIGTKAKIFLSKIQIKLDLI
jgi:hypothetical protein